MTRRPLFLLALALSSVAGAVALRVADVNDAWAGLVGFALALIGGVSLLVGFYSAAFLAGGQKVAWPLAIYVVTILCTVATLLLWVTLSARHSAERRSLRARPLASSFTPP